MRFDVPVPTAEIAGSGEPFPVRRIFCVGKNYADHAREMGGDPTREPPFFFSKPADALVEAKADIAMPPRTANLHHEIELVVALIVTKTIIIRIELHGDSQHPGSTTTECECQTCGAFRLCRQIAFLNN